MIDEHGEALITDLRFYYGIDLLETIRGDGMSPRLLLAHVRRLPDDSLFSAMQLGGREHFGWGIDRHMQADIYDALAFNTEASGNWSKKPPELPRWPRPKSNEPTPPPKRGVRIRELFAMFGGAGKKQ